MNQYWENKLKDDFDCKGEKDIMNFELVRNDFWMIAWSSNRRVIEQVTGFD